MSFPVILCLISAVSSFWTTVKLRNCKVRTNRARIPLSPFLGSKDNGGFEMGSWIAFGLGGFLVVGAILIAWLEHTGGRISN